MKRPSFLLWPLLVGALTLAATAWLWQHERQTQARHLRDNFDFGLRQTVTRVEQRMASYEQMLRGLRGLFDASDEVTRKDFALYVDALLGGADFAGLRNMVWAPWLDAARLPAFVAAQRTSGQPSFDVHPAAGSREHLAPIAYVAPDLGATVNALGYDPLSDATRSAAMLQARDSGTVAVTGRIRLVTDERESGFLMVMPVYAQGIPGASVQERRARLEGWVMAAFRFGDLMSSLYGEGTPGLTVRVYDGAIPDAAALIYGSPAAAAPAARFEAHEYIGFAGHTWTVVVRSQPDFESRYGSDSGRIILAGGAGLSGALALLTWLLVTGRERAHAAARVMTRQLRESAERYRGIVETADEGIWTVDAQGLTNFVNPKMVQLLGYSAPEMLGRRRADFLAEPAAVWGDETQPPTTPGAGAEPRRLRLRRKDGSDLWATLSTSPIRDAAGRHAGALVMVTDISERVLAEERRSALELQLRQSQKMEAIGTLAGGIAHDFNNVLAAILGNVALLQREPGSDRQGRLGQIGQAAARARSLVQQIVAFSRQQPQQLVAQDLHPLLEETVKLLRSTLPARVEIGLEVVAGPVRVAADATQLQQVLMNLCNNAWQAMAGAAGRIVIGLGTTVLDAEAARRVGVQQPGMHAHLWVRDNGTGMDEATRLRVFEPFFTTKPVGQGTGLGLAVVHGIVSSHRGAITVSSTPGQGSCFDIYFPLAVGAEADAALAPRPAQAATPAGAGEHVLYVDDDGVMGLMVEGLLRNLGYRVTCLNDPREALRRLRAEGDDTDIVVTDYNMPEMSGLELAEQLALWRPGLPLIISSGYVSDALRAEVTRIGVRHVLQKEYTLEQLGALVHRALAERGGAATAAAVAKHRPGATP